jgi:hypothetical protein
MNLQHFSAEDARFRCVLFCALLQNNAHLILINIACLETCIYSGEINKILLDLDFYVDYSLCVCYFTFFPYFPIYFEFPAFLSIFFSEFPPPPLSCFCAFSPSLCLYFHTSHISCPLISLKTFYLSSSHALFLSLFCILSFSVCRLQVRSYIVISLTSVLDLCVSLI